MSYFICKTERFKKSAILGLERENERLDSYNDATNHIDKSRSHLNYHLVAPNGSYTEIVNARIRSLDLKKPPRSDAVYLCSLVVSASSSFFETMSEYEQRDYFEDCADVLIARFGRENVVSAIVHKDESNPHLHFNFVPVRDGVLSSKKVFWGDIYESFQTQIYNAIGRPWGLDLGDLAYGNVRQPIEKFKNMQTMERAIELSDTIVDESRQEKKNYYEASEHVSALKAEESSLRLSVDALTDEKKALEKDIEDLKGNKDILAKARSGKIPMFGKKKAMESLLGENAALQASNEELEKARQESAEEQIRLQKEKKDLERQLKSKERLAGMAETAIKKSPEKFMELLHDGEVPQDNTKNTPEK